MTIPTADCTSLNLAQAVMVLAYELFTALSHKPHFEPRLANTRKWNPCMTCSRRPC